MSGTGKPAAHLSSAQLADMLHELSNLTERARALVSKGGGPNAAALLKRPGENQWSAAECLVHLALTNDGYDRDIGLKLEEAKQRGLTGRGPYRGDVIGRLLAWVLDQPGRFKSRTVPSAEPSARIKEGEWWPYFLAAQDRLRSRIIEADGVAIDRVKITSVFNSRVRYNLLSYFRITMAHERRHLWQAERSLAGR